MRLLRTSNFSSPGHAEKSPVRQFAGELEFLAN